MRIEDYALVGDTQTGALVGRNGSIDWLCLPRFDSSACFAALLGGPENGRWLLAPCGELRASRRQYRQDSMVLETELTTDEGTVRLTDFMPPRELTPDLVRIVEGVSGRVRMRMELVLRTDYGSTVPWVRRVPGGLLAVAGPDAFFLRSSVPLAGKNMTTVAEFELGPGERAEFVLLWHPSHLPTPAAPDPRTSLGDTDAWWQEWAAKCTYQGEWREAVMRSLLTLKALTYAPTGGIVAAATTSLPEWVGGVRNWDYRYCWLRDATLTLYSLMLAGYRDEAQAWREWLLRSVAGDPSKLQIMYGVAGERRLAEWDVPWLAGYEGSKPVRVGNAAVDQLQLDVYGEVMDALYLGRRSGLESSEDTWALQRSMMDFLESGWRKQDAGIWEVRGPPRDFTHSKVMAWTAMDRAVKSVELFGLAGPVDRWRATRATIHEEVCRKAYDPALGAFTQSYGSHLLDASLLLIPSLGFLPARDPRVLGTVRAIEERLCADGFVLRYATEEGGHVDGLPLGEGAFLACTYWLADNYALAGRDADARALFERLLSLRNDVGLLAEEYEPRAKRQLGNFPQAFSHVALVNTAFNLGASQHHPAEQRST